MCLGLNVVEVAHDIQKQVSKYVTATLKLTNSYDTWHGNTVHFPVLHIMNTILYLRYKECEEVNGETQQGSGEGHGCVLVPGVS